MRIFAEKLHHNSSPWETAPAWAIELGFMLALVLKEETIIMSQSDDLNNGITALATAFAVEHDAVNAELIAINAALGNTPNPAITQAIANIAAITGGMATDAAALTASIPAATTVAPPVLTPPPVKTPPADVVPDIATPPVTAPNAIPPSTPPASATTTA